MEHAESIDLCIRLNARITVILLAALGEMRTQGQPTRERVCAFMYVLAYSFASLLRSIRSSMPAKFICYLIYCSCIVFMNSILYKSIDNFLLCSFLAICVSEFAAYYYGYDGNVAAEHTHSMQHCHHIDVASPSVVQVKLVGNCK